MEKKNAHAWNYWHFFLDSLHAIYYKLARGHFAKAGPADLEFFDGVVFFYLHLEMNNLTYDVLQAVKDPASLPSEHRDNHLFYNSTISIQRS